MQIQLKNELMHAICAFEAKRSNWPNLGRKRKPTTDFVRNKIASSSFAGRGANGVNFVEFAFHKNVYHFCSWSNARFCRKTCFTHAQVEHPGMTRASSGIHKELEVTAPCAICRLLSSANLQDDRRYIFRLSIFRMTDDTYLDAYDEHLTALQYIL